MVVWCSVTSFSLRKTVGKVSPILVTLTSRSDSDFESSKGSLKENKPDGVNPNSNDIDFYVQKNEGKILWFSADCIMMRSLRNGQSCVQKLQLLPINNNKVLTVFILAACN